MRCRLSHILHTCTSMLLQSGRSSFVLVPSVIPHEMESQKSTGKAPYSKKHNRRVVGVPASSGHALNKQAYGEVVAPLHYVGKRTAGRFTKSLPDGLGKLSDFTVGQKRKLGRVEDRRTLTPYTVRGKSKQGREVLRRTGMLYLENR